MTVSISGVRGQKSSQCSSKPVKCIQGPIVYISNCSCNNNFIAEAAQTRVPKLTGDARGLAVFRRLIAYLRQGKRLFCVLVCYKGSAVYLACSLVPRPSPAPGFDRLQYAKTVFAYCKPSKTGAGEGLGTWVGGM